MDKIKEKQLAAAREVLASHPHFNEVWVNPNGHAFDKKSYALSTVRSEEELLHISRAQVEEGLAEAREAIASALTTSTTADAPKGKGGKKAGK